MEGTQEEWDMSKHLVGEMKGRHLTPRERQVLALMAGGHSNQEIATMLNIKYETVKNHVFVIMGKLGAKNRTHAVVLALGIMEQKEEPENGIVKYIRCPEQPTEC